jgi:hypothetical protein
MFGNSAASRPNLNRTGAGNDDIEREVNTRLHIPGGVVKPFDFPIKLQE